jgi:hypothetical protein
VLGDEAAGLAGGEAGEAGGVHHVAEIDAGEGG